MNRTDFKALAVELGLEVTRRKGKAGRLTPRMKAALGEVLGADWGYVHDVWTTAEGGGREEIVTALYNCETQPQFSDEWARFAWIADDAPGLGSNLFHYLYAEARGESGDETTRAKGVRGGRAAPLPKLTAAERRRSEGLVVVDRWGGYTQPYHQAFSLMTDTVRGASKEKLAEYLVNVFAFPGAP